MKTLLKSVTMCICFSTTVFLGQAQGVQGFGRAVVTEFDDIALDGEGSNPFIRFDRPGEPSYFLVGFDDNFGIWTGQNYCFRAFQADADLLTLQGSIVNVKGELEVLSDRDRKTNFQPINHSDILDKVAELNITTYQYKDTKHDVHHIGPVAQDFYRIFGMGNSSKSIAPLDAVGVALAAVQGLQNELMKRDRQIQDLQNQLVGLTEMVVEMRGSSSK